MPFPGGSGNPGHTTGGGGVPPPSSGGGGGGSSSGSSKPIPAPGFAGWEVTQTPHGPVVVGAVTSTGQLVRPGGIWPGTGGKRLIVPSSFSGGQPPPARVGGSPGAPGGGPPFVPPPGGGGGGTGGGGAGGSSGPSASESLFGVLSKMFPFITDFGNSLPGQSSGLSLGSTAGVIEDAAKVFGEIGALLGQFLQAVEILFTPTFWLRALCFLIGLPVTTYGLIQLGRSHSGGGTALGITAIGAGLILLFIAFHNLPDTVTSPGTLATFLQQEIQGGNILTAASGNQPGVTSSLFKPPITVGSATTGTTGP